MAKRINITIPNEIAENLEKYRSKMNISQICARALAEEVCRQEAAEDQMEVLQTEVQYLRAQLNGGPMRKRKKSVISLVEARMDTEGARLRRSYIGLSALAHWAATAGDKESAAELSALADEALHLLDRWIAFMDRLGTRVWPRP
jgi:post-segregation antitoxin (ccd killing protein)